MVLLIKAANLKHFSSCGLFFGRVDSFLTLIYALYLNYIATI